MERREKYLYCNETSVATAMLMSQGLALLDAERERERERCTNKQAPMRVHTARQADGPTDRETARRRQATK